MKKQEDIICSKLSDDELKKTFLSYLDKYYTMMRAEKIAQNVLEKHGYINPINYSDGLCRTATRYYKELKKREIFVPLTVFKYEPHVSKNLIVEIINCVSEEESQKNPDSRILYSKFFSEIAKECLDSKELEEVIEGKKLVL